MMLQFLLLNSTVAGSPHPIKGQKIKAFMMLIPGIAVTRELANKIFTYCKAHRAPYKGARLLKLVAELSKTIITKIKRIELRAAREQQKVLKATRPQNTICNKKKFAET